MESKYSLVSLAAEESPSQSLVFMKAPEAWTYSQGEGSSLVAFDTGMDFAHEDITVEPTHRLGFCASEPGPEDRHGHGTAIGGICASPHNGLGILGCAPAATLISAKVLNGQGNGRIEDIDAALDWAIKARPKVALITFGSTQPFPMYVEEKLRQLAGAGCIIVAGQKASRGTPIYPGAYTYVVSVDGPGDDSSADLRCWVGYMRVPIPGGGYDRAWPSNAASALVAGAAALLSSADDNLDGAGVRDLLLRTSYDHVANGRVYRQVDVLAAVRAIA